MTTAPTETSEQKAYHDVPYYGTSIPQSNLSRVLAVSSLYHDKTPSAEKAQVLELGCAAGHNLLPQAERYPSSHFVGVDLCPQAIARAKGFAESSGMGNVEFLLSDIESLSLKEQSFDVILAYGLLSWLRPSARDAFFEICAKLLKKEGVLLVSYNCYPGWHFKDPLREILLRSQSSDTPLNERTEKALSLLKYLEAYAPESPVRDAIRFESTRFNKYTPQLIAHDLLEEHNTPYYFDKLCEEAKLSGLTPLADVQFLRHSNLGMNAVTQNALDSLVKDCPWIEREQMADFFLNRTFRETVLVKSDTPLHEDPQVLALAKGFWAVPAQSTKFHYEDYASFFNPFDPDHPWIPALKKELITLRPSGQSGEALWQFIQAKLAEKNLPITKEEENTFWQLMLMLLISGNIELHANLPPIAKSRSQKPLASPYIRQMALHQYSVPNLYHHSSKFHDRLSKILSLCDGNHTEEQIAQKLNIPVDEISPNLNFLHACAYLNE